MVWVWQHGKRTNDCKIILNCVRKLMKNKREKMLREGPNVFKSKILFHSNYIEIQVYA
jgi:hypothetical protein